MILAGSNFIRDGTSLGWHSELSRTHDEEIDLLDAMLVAAAEYHVGHCRCAH